MPHIIRSAKAKGLTIVFNPAPMNPQVLNYPLELVDILFVNETAARCLSGEIEPEKIYETLNHRYPNMAIVLTMGHNGAAYFSPLVRFFQPAEKVRVIDSTQQAPVTRLLASFWQNSSKPTIQRPLSPMHLVRQRYASRAMALPARSRPERNWMKFSNRFEIVIAKAVASWEF